MTTKFLWTFFKEKFRALAQELKLQAGEYKRRLRDLNGEAKRLRKMQELYVQKMTFDRLQEDFKKMQTDYISKEVFESSIGPFRTRLETVEKWMEKQLGKGQLLRYIPWIMMAINLALAFVMFFKSKK